MTSKRNFSVLISRNFPKATVWATAAFLLCSFIGSAQPHHQSRLKAKGVVVDSITGESLPFANILSASTPKENTVADADGRFSIRTGGNGKDWSVSYTGYDPKPLIFSQSDTTLVYRLSPSTTLLTEFVVKPKKEKYSKKNNPAVDFVNRLRKESSRHDPANREYYSYDLYEKTVIGVNDFNKSFNKGFFSKSGKFLENYVDTSSWTGKRILDLMLKEKRATRLDGKTARKEIIRGYRSVGVDEVINQDNMRVILEDAIREIDVFADNITFLQNRFVSPLSKIGPDFYKYYLTDTVNVGGDRCIELSFAPHNPESMGFNGKIYVPLGDSTMFVKKITMRTPGAINLNLVDNILVNLSFEKDSLGNRHKVYDDVCLEMSLIPQAPKMYGRKTTAYSNFSYAPRQDAGEYYDKLGSLFVVDESESRPSDFWTVSRMVPLSRAEANLGGMMKEARKNKLFYWGEKFLSLMESGYIRTGKPSKVDLGPINTLISGNTVEGVRLRVGGMTMSPLNPHLFAKGFVAYGTRDHRWKYDAQLEYSFTEKKNHSYEWPRHGFYAHASYDLDMLGQHYLFTNADNVFLSFKRKESILVTYRQLYQGGYILELPNNFSVEASVRHEVQEATRWMPFAFADGRISRQYKQTAGMLSLRWAPGEKFVQGRTTRLPVNMDAWIFQLTHEYGPKGLFGSPFTLNRTELSIQKRLWLSAFGYTDIILKGGIIWSSVYYPALLWPNANLSYTIQPESYSLMNPMEFANDKYASIDFSYYGMGILFNRIPLIKKLKLREIVTFKGLMGGLSPRNNPEMNPELYQFPEDAHSRVMGKKPYMEIGVGLDNILMFFRVDYVWRLTYRDTPGCDKSGLRFAFHFSF